MTDQFGSGTDLDDGDLQDLLGRRAAVQGWLDGLSSQEGSVSDRVLQRVREDYTGRLHQILDALTAHRQAVHGELQRASVRLENAERQYTDAVEELEEGRLRNMIGELDSETWTERADRLDEAVRQAEEGRQTARAEISRLRELLDQLDERTADTSSAAADPPAVPEPIAESEPVPSDLPSVPDDDEQTAEEATFLEQVDHALTESPFAIVEEEPEVVEDTAPKPGLKCAECGYTNDLSAWFCGVCGADVG